MPYRVRRRDLRPAVLAMTLIGVGPALSADLDYPPYMPPESGPNRIFREERIEEPLPPPLPSREPRFTAGPHVAPPLLEACRTIVKRRIDEDGDEVERRVRICEDAPYPRTRPRYRPSLYDPGGPPLPPAEVPDERFEPPPRW